MTPRNCALISIFTLLFLFDSIKWIYYIVLYASIHDFQLEDISNCIWEVFIFIYNIYNMYICTCMYAFILAHIFTFIDKNRIISCRLNFVSAFLSVKISFFHQPSVWGKAYAGSRSFVDICWPIWITQTYLWNE